MIRRQNAVLLVIDPLFSFLNERVNPNSDRQIRKALIPLAQMAERTGVAVLITRHPNKRINLPALYRGGGSLGGISGVVRSGLMIGPHPLDPSKRILAVTKANNYPNLKSLAFRLEPVTKEIARVEWQGFVDITANELVERLRPADKAAIFLRQTLKQGAVRAEKIEGLAARKGISKRTLARVRKQLEIKADKKGFGGHGYWQWSLPREPGRR
jgi:hypothetical protein